MGISNFFKLKKCLIRLGSNFILSFLGFIDAAIRFMETAFSGYGWRAFLARLFIVVISFVLNPFNSAVSQFSTGAMKLFLLTCVILAYTIFKLIFDYTKRGKELHESRRIE